MAKKKDKSWSPPRRDPRKSDPSDVVVTYPDDIPELPPYTPAKRTYLEFIETMLADKADWIDMLGVARQVRNGAWYEDIKAELQRRGLMPKSRKEIDKGLDVVRKRLLNPVVTHPPRKARRRAPSESRGPSGAAGRPGSSPKTPS